MSNSSLISYTEISPNKKSPRTHAIDTVTIHCVVGQASVESLGAEFQKISRRASANYGIGYDGKIALYVEEKDRSQCSSSSSNDNRAITIEVASDTDEPYAVTAEAYAALIDLLVDICKRNNIKKLLWKADKSLVGQVDKQNMSVHRWFAKDGRTCPGTYLYNHHSEIADEVNKRLLGDELDMTKEELLSIAGTGDKPETWEVEATEAMKALGIMEGDGNGNYGWQQPMTRGAMAVTLYRFMKKINGGE